MSKIDEARAVRYLIDALDDEAIAGIALEKKILSQAVFHSQQICEKAAKACLALFNIIIADEHKYSGYLHKIIIPNAGKLKNGFSKLLIKVSNLETFYIPSRYGVDVQGKVHYSELNEEEVTDSYNSAKDFLNLSFQLINKKIKKELPMQKGELAEYLKKNYKEVIKES